MSKFAEAGGLIGSSTNLTGGKKMKELTDQEYMRSVQPIRNLQQVHGSRPFTNRK